MGGENNSGPRARARWRWTEVTRYPLTTAQLPFLHPHRTPLQRHHDEVDVDVVIDLVIIQYGERGRGLSRELSVVINTAAGPRSDTSAAVSFTRANPSFPGSADHLALRPT